MKHDIETRMIAIDLLVPNEGQIPGVPRNPRKISKKQLALLKKSIQEDPEMLELRETLVYEMDGKYVMVDGNMRRRALVELGYKEVLCKIVPQGTSPEKIRAYIVKFNSTFGDWDTDLLSTEWADDPLGDWGFDVDILPVQGGQ